MFVFSFILSCLLLSVVTAILGFLALPLLSPPTKPFFSLTLMVPTTPACMLTTPYALYMLLVLTPVFSHLSPFMMCVYDGMTDDIDVIPLPYCT